MDELLDLLAEDADHFGCSAEVARARDIVRDGTSADRQLARFEEVKELGGSDEAALLAVTDDIIEETKAGPLAPQKPSPPAGEGGEAESTRG
jgi:carboxylate-amine ligase